MKPLKVMTIIGTRPEIIRLSKVIRTFDDYFTHILVHTGQNWDYTLNEIFFKELNLRPVDYYLNCVGENLGKTIGNIISYSYDLLQKVKPDALLILGDTNSALSSISAKRLKIPIFHMEAGNRCFDQNVPEEINRKIVDHISDVNLPYTEHSRRYLLSEGFPKEYIFVTGSPMPEVLNDHLEAIRQSTVLNELNLKPQEYILVSAHREENIDNKKHFFLLMNALNAIAEKYQFPVIYSTHPRSQGFIDKYQFKFHPLVKNLKPLSFINYNKLQQNAFCVLSDSGTLSEEAAILGFNGILIRTSTERPEVLDKGNIVIGGITKSSILQAIKFTKNIKKEGLSSPLPSDYQDCNVSYKVAKIIQSYTPIINKNIWHKS